MNEDDVFDIIFGNDFSFENDFLDFGTEKEKEYALTECDYCDNPRMEIIESNMNKFGQLITTLKCPNCKHKEMVCEIGNGQRIERENKC